MQAEADVDSLVEQVSQAETKNRSPFKRRTGLTDEEMGMPLMKQACICILINITHAVTLQTCCMFEEASVRSA